MELFNRLRFIYTTKLYIHIEIAKESGIYFMHYCISYSTLTQQPNSGSKSILSNTFSLIILRP